MKLRPSSSAGTNLFLVGFLVLFMELACIRWFASYVVFMQFFANVVLIAAFLGMSCGCLAARQRRNWLEHFPYLALITMVAALAFFVIYRAWNGLAIDVGGQMSPQEVFFGTESRNPDVAQFAVPIEIIVAAFFVLIALMFVGPGQVLGRAFEEYPDRIAGYSLNVGGSLSGIAVFSAISFLHAPPVLWFAVIAAGVAYLVHRTGTLTVLRGAALASLLAIVLVPDFVWASRGYEVQWSPYYSVVRRVEDGQLEVNTITQQYMVPFEKAGASYSLIHLLQRHAGGQPFGDMLVVGAGSGNDIAHALRFGVKNIDAIEIDPVIQAIGVNHHPDQPYQDPRVVRHLDDGRHYLRVTDRKYDLIVYALVDSLILHSGYSNLRLESFLFTEQAFGDIRRALKPGGVFVTYNYFRQGWIVERVAAMSESVFGCKPTILSLPYLATLKSSDRAGFTMVLSACDHPLAKVFEGNRTFWLNVAPPENLGVEGFDVHPEAMSPAVRRQWTAIAPTTLLRDNGPTAVSSDDWPFLYLSARQIPNLSVRSMIMLGVLGLGMVWAFLPKGRVRIHSRMFFLGAAFMLLETKAVVQLALLFGSTWLVNSLVFATVLLLILIANIYVLKSSVTRLAWHYVGLLALLSATVIVPFDVFLSGGIVWRYVIPCVLALGPMYFAGVIFARTFGDARDAEQALGSNIAGAVLGGLCESCSMFLGFSHLLVLAIVFYGLSMWSPSAGARRSV
jgi:spermidine synthase